MQKQRQRHEAASGPLSVLLRRSEGGGALLTITNATPRHSQRLLDLINGNAAKEVYKEAIVPVDPSVLQRWIEQRHSIVALAQSVGIGPGRRIVGHTAIDMLGMFKSTSGYGSVHEVMGVEIRSQIVHEDYRGQRVYAGLTAAGLWNVWQMYESSGICHVVFVHKGPGSQGLGLITNGLGFRNITPKLFQPYGSIKPTVLTDQPTSYMDYLPEGMKAGALRRGPTWQILARKITKISGDAIEKLMRDQGWEHVR